jgi:hypothetical protein
MVNGAKAMKRLLIATLSAAALLGTPLAAEAGNTSSNTSSNSSSDSSGSFYTYSRSYGTDDGVWFYSWEYWQPPQRRAYRKWVDDDDDDDRPRRRGWRSRDDDDDDD